MTRVLIVAATLIALAAPAAAQNTQTTFRDSRGSTIGTATRNGDTTVFRDSRGSATGTATTTPGGQTTYRDPRGSTVGTSSRPAR